MKLLIAKRGGMKLLFPFLALGVFAYILWLGICAVVDSIRGRPSLSSFLLAVGFLMGYVARKCFG